MRSYLKLLTSVTVCILIACLCIGCMATQKDNHQVQTNQSSQNMPATNVPVDQGAAKQSGLSYGMVTSKVEKKVTTQAQLIELFGGPNIATTDSDGLETWVYERTATQSQVSQDATVNSQVQRLGIFFGIGVTGNDKASTQVDSHSSVTSSIKTLTVIIKFNKDKTVQDFSVRTASF
jgi:hypothetical protein